MRKELIDMLIGHQEERKRKGHEKMEEIVKYLDKYRKADVRYYDDLDRERDTLQESEKTRKYMLEKLESAINEYIDDRIEKWMTAVKLL